jgi:signal transduction histidine kinase
MTNRSLPPKTNRSPAASTSPGDTPQRPEAVQQAAHDLRQPVAAVLALASAALADSQMPPRARRCLEQIVAEANWISKIIQDMLAGPPAAHNAEAVDIARLVRDTVNAEQLTCAQQIILHQPDHGPRYVMAVSTRLRRALANVLANATHAAGPDGHVQLTDRADGGTELIEIIDDGPGFEPATVREGTGIGLRITRKILAECGGRMEVERLSSGQTLVKLFISVITDRRTADGGK